MFSAVAARQQNPDWPILTQRDDPLYGRKSDPRSDFNRDYNRILHCTAYRRLKHKTQVFFATENDHICTRIEHVNHVLSVSHTIAEALDLNAELTDAIAIGHDIGHAPFGHEGEKILNEIARDRIGDRFWHEKNSLWFVDQLETIADPNNKQRNLALTYAVRDGIISHCGEVDETSIFPRQEAVDLHTIQAPNEVQPYTWEGCIVKVADKIAFLGRDIEDAVLLGIVPGEELRSRYHKHIAPLLNLEGPAAAEVTNTALIHSFILDLCKSSNPAEGIRLSAEGLEAMRELRKLSEELIYDHHRLTYFRKLASLVLNSIFDALSVCYAGDDTLVRLQREFAHSPLLRDTFSHWIIKYTCAHEACRANEGYENKIVYDLGRQADYDRAMVDFISGMTDTFALRVFDELTRLL